MKTLSECLISGHYLTPDPKYVTFVDADNITHLPVKCKRCGAERTLHLDNKKSL